VKRSKGGKKRELSSPHRGGRKGACISYTGWEIGSVPNEMKKVATEGATS